MLVRNTKLITKKNNYENIKLKQYFYSFIIRAVLKSGYLSRAFEELDMISGYFKNFNGYFKKITGFFLIYSSNFLPVILKNLSVKIFYRLF